MGKPGSTSDFDIVLDNQTVTALTETWKWIFDKERNRIV
jgi:hypothetical protein